MVRILASGVLTALFIVFSPSQAQSAEPLTGAAKTKLIDYLGRWPVYHAIDVSEEHRFYTIDMMCDTYGSDVIEATLNTVELGKDMSTDAVIAYVYSIGRCLEKKPAIAASIYKDFIYNHGVALYEEFEKQILVQLHTDMVDKKIAALESEGDEDTAMIYFLMRRAYIENANKGPGPKQHIPIPFASLPSTPGAWPATVASAFSSEEIHAYLRNRFDLVITASLEALIPGLVEVFTKEGIALVQAAEEHNTQGLSETTARWHMLALPALRVEFYDDYFDIFGWEAMTSTSDYEVYAGLMETLTALQTEDKQYPGHEVLFRKANKLVLNNSRIELIANLPSTKFPSELYCRTKHQLQNANLDEEQRTRMLKASYMLLEMIASRSEAQNRLLDTALYSREKDWFSDQISTVQRMYVNLVSSPEDIELTAEDLPVAAGPMAGCLAN